MFLIPSQLVKEIKGVVGAENVLEDEVDLLGFSYDASENMKMPDLVVRPGSTQEVVEIVKLAVKNKIPLIPRGSGTNLCGGTIPVLGGIIVDMQRMRNIVELDEENLCVTVEAGIKLLDLNKYLQRKGFFFPVDPGSSNSATIGGMISNNSSGMHSLKYGSTKDNLLELEVVLPNGEIISVGSKAPKQVSGYDLKSLFVGAEGTLGIITKATLKIKPFKETFYLVVTAAFKSLEDAGRAISRIIKEDIPVSALEFMDKYTVRSVKEFTGLDLPLDAEAVVLVECSGHEASVKYYIDEAEKILREEKAYIVEKAKNIVEAEDLWKGRQSSFGAIARVKPFLIQGDPSVPVSKLPEFVRGIEEIAKKNNVIVVTYGHAGEGNLHPTVVTDERDKDELERGFKAMGEIYRLAISLGGTSSGEHGVGLSKAKYMSYEHGEKVLNVMRQIKKVFDPFNIMNPGKMSL